MSSGNLAGAERELQAVLHVLPKECRALDLLGVIRILQHREAEAENLFQQAIESRPDFASAHAHLGLLYSQSGRDGEAIPELQAAIRLDPGRTDASDALVHIFRAHAKDAASNGDPKQALGLLIQARRLAPRNPDVEFEFASAAFQMSLLQDAADGFRETLKQRKDDALAVYGLGRAYGGLGKLDEARQQFEHYVALRPDDPSGYCSLGITLAALERPDEARTQFAKSIALAPEQSEAYFRRGVMELHLNNLDQASTYLKRVLDRDPNHAGALSALGRVEFMQKHYAQAADLLQSAIANDESFHEAHYYLGLAYGRMGEKNKSDQEFQRATQLEHQEVEKRKSLWNRLELPPASAQQKQ
jgi:tetratricopeptide (TPR) repeat protein